MSRPVALHRSLVVRLLGTSVLIVVLSVATAAWLAAKTATRAAEQEHGQSLAGDSQIYDTLLGYAARHPDWDGVQLIVDKLGDENGRQVTLTTADGKPIAASHPDAPLPGLPSAVIDPLGAASGTIDPRAVGPYELSPQDRTEQHRLAASRLECLHKQGLEARLDQMPSGRSAVRLAARNPRPRVDCLFNEDKPTKTEWLALQDLTIRAGRCTKNLHLPTVTLVSVVFTWQYANPEAQGLNTRDIQDCVDAARRDQLRPYVAAPARLYLTTPARPPTPMFDLSTASTWRIAGATGFVLLVAITATLVVGVRMVRPLRALIAAAHEGTRRPAPVSIARKDEIGRLARALNDVAERRDRSEHQRRTMVNDIAHELRSPLTNIRNWLTAGQDGLAELDQDMVGLLLEESGLRQHIVADLADLADADAGTLALNAGEHYITDLLTQVTEAHRGESDRVGVTVDLTVTGDPRAVVDPARLRQIVGNLLSNAIRYTPTGGRVDVRARIEDKDLVIEVADTGDGIPAADLPYVFDRFWRADKARTRATGGTGLGLSIARKLTQAHGGDITVASTPDQGSKFAVRLPRGTA